MAWEWPFKDIFVTSDFGPRKSLLGSMFKTGPNHSGADIRASFIPLEPIGAGKVLFAGNKNDAWGNQIQIDHGNGIVSLYAHLSEINVNTGDTVGKDQLIGKTGATGNVTGPHLHLSVYQNGQAVDPVAFIKNAVMPAETNKDTPGRFKISDGFASVPVAGSPVAMAVTLVIAALLLVAGSIGAVIPKLESEG